MSNHGMEALTIYHHDDLYTAYPFGLVRYGLYNLRGKERRCTKYPNRSVALLRNRQIKGNMGVWLAEVFRKVGPVALIVDAVDLAVGIAVAKLSKLMGNYGVMTVVARVNRQKKSNPHEEDC